MTAKRPHNSDRSILKPIKISYFKDTDTAFIQLLDKLVFETREISDNVLIDIDEYYSNAIHNVVSYDN